MNSHSTEQGNSLFYEMTEKSTSEKQRNIKQWRRVIIPISQLSQNNEQA